MSNHLVLEGWSHVEVTESENNLTVTAFTAFDGVQTATLTVDGPEVAVDVSLTAEPTSPPTITGIAVTLQA